MRTRALVGLVLAFGCSDQGPRPYTIAGTWEGTSAQGLLHVDFTHAGSQVGGAGHFTTSGGQHQSFTLNRTDGTPAGSLSGDSSIFVAAVSIPDGVNAACEGNLQGVFRQQESNAGSFQARFSCGPWVFQGALTRR